MFFSIATWVLKNIFSGQVNNAAEPLFEILFIAPSSPYWYLYALFFIFVVTPRINKNTTCICLFVISFVFNIASDYVKTGIYAIDIVLHNEIWFVLGMLINKIELDKFIKKTYNVIVGAVGLIIFVIVSIIIYQTAINLQIISTLLGMMACMSILTITINVCDDNKGTKALKFFSKYTMPIFLMHTIFAAGFRAILLKLQINSFIVHTVVGVSVSIIGPIIAAMVMKKTVILEFFLYPNKFFEKRKIINENIDG